MCRAGLPLLRFAHGQPHRRDRPFGAPPLAGAPQIFFTICTISCTPQVARQVVSRGSAGARHSRRGRPLCHSNRTRQPHKAPHRPPRQSRSAPQIPPPPHPEGRTRRREQGRERAGPGSPRPPACGPSPPSVAGASPTPPTLAHTCAAAAAGGVSDGEQHTRHCPAVPHTAVPGAGPSPAASYRPTPAHPTLSCRQPLPPTTRACPQHCSAPPRPTAAAGARPPSHPPSPLPTHLNCLIIVLCSRLQKSSMLQRLAESTTGSL